MSFKDLKVYEINSITPICSIAKSNNYSIEIEIGCGNGHFLTNYGETKKNSLIIGIDTKQKRCLKAIKKIDNKGLENIYVICGRAEELITNLPVSMINKFHIYFPDPWPKNRHKRRRFFRLNHLNTMCKSLIHGGKILFSTDVFDYYIQTRVLLSLHKELYFDKTPPPTELYSTVFCQRFMDEGKNIYFTSAIKRN